MFEIAKCSVRQDLESIFVSANGFHGSANLVHVVRPTGYRESLWSSGPWHNDSVVNFGAWRDAGEGFESLLSTCDHGGHLVEVDAGVSVGIRLCISVCEIALSLARGRLRHVRLRTKQSLDLEEGRQDCDLVTRVLLLCR